MSRSKILEAVRPFSMRRFIVKGLRNPVLESEVYHPMGHLSNADALLCGFSDYDGLHLDGGKAAGHAANMCADCDREARLAEAAFEADREEWLESLHPHETEGLA